METRDIFKKYLVYSVGFHVFVVALFFIFWQSPRIPEETTTQVTMLRFTRSIGSENSALSKKTGSPGQSAPQPPPVKPQEKVAETPPAQPPVQPPVKPPVQPPVKPPPTPTKPPPTPAKPPPTKPTVTIPAKKPEKQAAKPPPTAPAPQPPAAPAKPAAPSEEDKKMAEALAGVNHELQERETQSQPPAAPAASGDKPGPGTGPGVPGETGGSAFGSPGGTVAATDPALARYQSQVRSKIIREWVRTASGSEGEVLRVRVVVRINASGSVVSSSLARRSGNASFDNSALRAVERASPLPAPPQIIMAEALQEGFVVDFSSRMLK